jgi:signal peptidase I
VAGGDVTDVENPAPGDDGDSDTEAQAESAGPTTARKRVSWLTEIVIVVVVALVVALTVKTYLVQPFSIPSGSMENTLLVSRERSSFTGGRDLGAISWAVCRLACNQAASRIV